MSYNSTFESLMRAGDRITHDHAQGRVGYIHGSAFHLWHGQVKDRGYHERHRWLKLFDPYTDIALDEQGCWRWSSNKPEMHARVRGYFELRDEDALRHGTNREGVVPGRSY